VIRALRRESSVPIVILTARGDETDKVAGLELGADDYVVKPFSPRELVERVKAILRRSRPGPGRDGRVLAQDGLVLEPEKNKVTLDGEALSLTPTEYALLHALMAAREIMARHLKDEPTHGAFIRAGVPKGFQPASAM